LLLLAAACCCPQSSSVSFSVNVIGHCIIQLKETHAAEYTLLQLGRMSSGGAGASAPQKSAASPPPVVSGGVLPPLPQGWEKLVDGEGKTYYGNPEMKITQYEHPAMHPPRRQSVALSDRSSDLDMEKVLKEGQLVQPPAFF